MSGLALATGQWRASQSSIGLLARVPQGGEQLFIRRLKKRRDLLDDHASHKEQDDKSVEKELDV